MTTPMRLLFFLACPCVLFFASCNSSTTLFKKISPDQSGIHFNNVVIENDSVNPMDLEFLYNGGGVGVGDFDNDGLPDLYFTASTTSNKLYLNKGNFKFSDITEEAKVKGDGEWFNAVSVVDINNDGWKDIYLSASILKDPSHRKNLLYINQGLDKNKVPVFKEMAAEYGLADTSLSVHAAFFDYDNDGDLDMYLVTTKLARRDAQSFNSNHAKDTSLVDYDKLFRCDWNDSLKHPVYTDVSKEAGIHHPGFGLGIAVADINKDGWKDIYVTNDFYSSDLLYINNKNGTFSEKSKECLKHTSQSAMGNDIADINNDGLADIISVDMAAEDNYRKKKNMAGNNYNVYRNMLWQGYMLQYARNTLQLNMGPRVNGEDSIGEPVFGDIGFYAGVAETDWSWTPSLADFDNDGYRDLLVTNGYPKDVTDHDFLAYRNETGAIASKQQLIAEIPQIKIPNYAFRNTGKLQFENMTQQWGLSEPSFSSGAVYVDLDNDGDLDYVINNINEEATVYENTLNSPGKVNANYLSVQFEGSPQNRNGFGAWAEIYYDSSKMQVYENSPYRGYLSTVDDKAYFGLGKTTVIDSVVIRWPNFTKQVLTKVPVNQVLKVNIKNAAIPDSWTTPVKTSQSYFSDITAVSGIDFVHKETDYIDFNRERLLPHKLSQYGPGLAAADVDKNGLDDIYVGGNSNNPGRFYLQQADGKFIAKDLPLTSATNKPEQMGLLFFDADGDGDPDLYCASGSNEFTENTSYYQDVLYVNDGKGNFTIDSLALPQNFTSKSCVKAADIDNDGDLDLFIGGRVLPGSYPKAVSSYIYRNDSKDGKIKFTDITDEVAKGLKDVGLVCDAIWTDFDNDGAIDLILAGEWMPVTFFKNKNGHFENITEQTGVAKQSGWWNSIAAGDFDNDGDMDYIVGNLGKNSFYRANDQYPAHIYGKDFDNNRSFDAIPTIFLKDKGQQGQMKEFTAQNRDDIVEQLPVTRKKFLTYKSFGEATFQDLFTAEQLKDVLELQANDFYSCLLKNNGNGKFELIPLPVAAQLAPLYGMIVDDFNNDGNLDVAICGNDFGTEVTNGRYDAMNGLLLTGDGKGNFAPKSIVESGLFIPGDAKALVRLRGANDNYLVAASQNKGPLKLFNSRSANKKIIPLNPDDKTISITLANGLTRKEEVYFGNSFLSQSSLFINMNPSIKKIEVINTKGQKRTIQ
ncbi:MAG: VCBS repeat-containing protein [Chitinophagaceae bacterium]